MFCRAGEQGGGGERVRVRVGVGGLHWKGHHLESSQATLIKRLKCSNCLNQEFTFSSSSPRVHKGLLWYGLHKGGFCILKRLEDKGGGGGGEKEEKLRKRAEGGGREGSGEVERGGKGKRNRIRDSIEHN